MLLHRNFPKILLAFLVLIKPLISIAQEVPPGGVSGPIYWFKTTSNAAGQYSWKDAANSKLTLISFPQTQNRIINFNPSLYFSGDNTQRIALHNVKLDQFTITSAFFPEYLAGSLQPTNENFYRLSESGIPLINFSASQTINRGLMLDYGQEQGSNFVLKNTGSITQAMKIAFSQGVRLSPAISNPWSAGHEFLLSFSLKGYCPEFVIYGRQLTKTEALRLNSYFAIKYGLTLDTTYVNSKNQIIWDPAANPTFHHRLSAIAKDHDAALIQPFSNSTYEEQFQNKTSYQLNGDKSSNRSVTLGIEPVPYAGLKDKTYLFFGDDNQSTSSSDFYQINSAFKGVAVMKRQWLLQNDSLINTPTTVVAGGPVFEQMVNRAGQDGIQPCYLLVKTKLPFSRSNIIPLSAQHSASATWEQTANHFTFGVVEQLRFKAKQASVNLDTVRCGALENLSYDFSNDLLHIGKFYVFRVRATIIPPGLSCLRRIVYNYDGHYLTFYLFGGVAPYDCTVIDNTTHTPVATITLPFQISSTYSLPAVLRSGRYTLSVKDQTNQVTELPIHIQ